jgi:hypothetical protein
MAEPDNPPPKKIRQSDLNIQSRWRPTDDDPPSDNEHSKMMRLRHAKARETAKKNALFDAAVEAVATRLDREIAVSEQFVEDIKHDLLKALGVKKVGREKIENSARRLQAARLKKI